MPEKLIGLDIGYLHVRAVSVERKGKRWQIGESAEVSRFDDLGQRKPLPRALAELDSRLPLKKGKLTVGASELAQMVRYEHNDPMPADRMERVLRLELSQHAGIEEGDLAADAIALPINADEIIHCCGLAQPPQVVELVDEIEELGCQVAQVQLAPAAAGNVLESLPDSDDENRYALLVDIGARNTRVILARGSDFIACRQLPIGGDGFTEHLAKTRGIRFDQAEAVKLDLQHGHGSGLADIVAVDEHDEDELDLDDTPAEGNPVIPDTELADSDSKELKITDSGIHELRVSRPDTGSFEVKEPTPPAGQKRADDLQLDDDDDDDFELDDSQPFGSPAAAGVPPPPTGAMIPAADPFASIDVDVDPLAAGASAAGEASAANKESSVSSQETVFEPGAASDALPFTDVFASETDEKSKDDDTIHLDPADLITTDVEEKEEPAGTRSSSARTHSQIYRLDEEEPAKPGRSTMTIGVTQLGPELLRSAEDLFTQVSKTLSWFKAQLKQSGIEVDAVYLMGGGADLAGLVPYLQRRFQKRVAICDPFASLPGTPPQQPHLYGQALGLALSAKPDAVRFDLRPESLQRKTLFKEVIIWPRVAAALLLLGAAAFIYGLLLQQGVYEKRTDKYKTQQRQFNTYKKNLDQLEKEQVALKGDLRAVASRIFAGRDLLDSIRALKMHAPETLWVTQMSTHNLAKQTKLRSMVKRDSDRTDADKSDTTIDRGSLFITGYVKPTAGEDFHVWYEGVRQWYDKLNAYTTQQRGTELFMHVEFLGAKWELDGDRPFIYRFDFRPTELDEVVENSKQQE